MEAGLLGDGLGESSPLADTEAEATTRRWRSPERALVRARDRCL